MTDESFDGFLLLCKKSLINAEHFLGDAIILRERKSFGHANSLAILGFEELSKSWWAFFSFLGFPEMMENERKSIFSHHLSKHKYGWEAFEAFYRVYFEIQLEKTEYKIKFQNIMDDSKLNLETRENQIGLLIKDISKNEEDETIALKAEKLIKIREISNHIDNKILNNKRNAGFYVSDVDISGKINTPQDFTNEDTKFIDTFENLVHFFREFFEEIVSNLDKKFFKDLLYTIRIIFQKERQEKNNPT